jgi:hypothetical protein
MRVANAARRAAALGPALALLATACERAPAPPASRPAGVDAGAAGIPAPALLNRVWVNASPDAPRGAMLVFLADGTLVQDSCFETYRLSRWRADDLTSLRWTEDTAEVAVTIVSVTGVELKLEFTAPAGLGVVSYRAAEAPYVCPDLPR